MEREEAACGGFGDDDDDDDDDEEEEEDKDDVVGLVGAVDAVNEDDDVVRASKKRQRTKGRSIYTGCFSYLAGEGKKKEAIDLCCVFLSMIISDLKESRYRY